jgi:hypothetical protein
MSRCKKFIALCMAVWATVTVAEADAFFDALNPPLRTAWSYLRTQNTDLALLELDMLLTNLPVQSDTSYKAVLLETVAVAEAGDVNKAAQLLQMLRQNLRQRNAKSGETIFSDCIWDANRAGDMIWPHITAAPDLQNTTVQQAVLNSLATYQTALKKCGLTAPATIAQDVEFRRLMDGTLPSLDIAIKGVSEKDSATLYRYLIEIISYDRLLYFRFG